MTNKIRHAYLICAHSNYKTLSLLLKALDSDNVDIYLHIDQKSQFTSRDKEKLLENIKSSKVYFSKRIDIRWGGYSQTQMFIILMQQALSTSKYDYFHMITGHTLPIKSKDFIENFYVENYGKEFIHFSTTDGYDRVKYFWPYVENFSNLKGIKKIINKVLLALQRRLNVDIFKRHKIEYKWGSAYGSITENFAKYLVSQEKKIKKYFSHTPISCESYLQTVIWNSPFKDNIFAFNENCNHLLYVKWDSGYCHAESITPQEIEMISKKSKSLWACKFDDETSYECYNKITNQFTII